MNLYTKHCASCGAEIHWITTENGAAHPLDAKPEKRWVVDRNDVGRIIDTYVSHFATCPDAQKHRKER